MFAQHSLTRHGGPLRKLLAAAALTACTGLAACTATLPSAAESVPTADAALAPHAAPLPTSDADLDAGTYLSSAYSVPFEVTVPEGWTYVNDRVLRKDVGDTEGVFVWFGHATKVPADACDWTGTNTIIEPTVEGFVQALAAQTSTTTTDPTEVSVGGYSGLEFDFSVEGVADLSECDGDKICIHSESSGCTRWYNSSTAQRETYRVLDLDGERAVLSFGEFDDRTQPALVEEAQEVFDSITFVTDD